ncbi:hypothetical protein PFISCL1PPCAC_25695, partial [Pristionchus fissidentatus]
FSFLEYGIFIIWSLHSLVAVVDQSGAAAVRVVRWREYCTWAGLACLQSAVSREGAGRRRPAACAHRATKRMQGGGPVRTQCNWAAPCPRRSIRAHSCALPHCESPSSNSAATGRFAHSQVAHRRR